VQDSMNLPLFIRFREGRDEGSDSAFMKENFYPALLLPDMS